MLRFIFVLFACGCASNPKYTLSTEAKTSVSPYAIEHYVDKIDLNIQFRKEW